MRAAQFDCTVELLAEVLHMPPGARVIGAEMSDSMRSVRFTVDDPSLPEAPDPYLCIPVITREAFKWDWKVPS